MPEICKLVAALLRFLPGAIATVLFTGAALNICGLCCRDGLAFFAVDVAAELPVVRESRPVPPPPPAAVVSPGLQIVKVLRRVSPPQGGSTVSCGRIRDDIRQRAPTLDRRAQQSAVLANAASLSRLCRLLL